MLNAGRHFSKTEQRKFVIKIQVMLLDNYKESEDDLKEKIRNVSFSFKSNLDWEESSLPIDNDPTCLAL